MIQFNLEMISNILNLWWLFTVRLSAFRHINIRNADHLSIEIKIIFEKQSFPPSNIKYQHILKLKMKQDNMLGERMCFRSQPDLSILQFTKVWRI